VGLRPDASSHYTTSDRLPVVSERLTPGDATERLNGEPTYGRGVNREHVVSGLLALFALLALGGAAAALDAPVAGSGGAGGSGGDAGVGVGSDSQFRIGLGGGNVSTVGGSPLPPWLYQLVLVLMTVGFFAGIYLFYRDHGLKRMATLSAVMAIGLLAVYYLFNSLQPSEPTSNRTGGLLEEVQVPGGAASGQESAQQAVNDPPTALLLLLGVVLLGAVAIIVRSSGDQTVELGLADADAESETDVSAVAAAAGRAADRIDEDAELDNAVYRAWREMTTHLPVDNPASSTPAEFAEAAVAAGMDREDVAELTRLFEAVRYGDEPITPEREDRAVAALRNIERTYADVSTEGVAGDPAPAEDTADDPAPTDDPDDEPAPTDGGAEE
jgi:hypothetical protein